MVPYYSAATGLCWRFGLVWSGSFWFRLWSFSMDGIRRDDRIGWLPGGSFLQFCVRCLFRMEQLWLEVVNSDSGHRRSAGRPLEYNRSGYISSDPFPFSSYAWMSQRRFGCGWWALGIGIDEAFRWHPMVEWFVLAICPEVLSIAVHWLSQRWHCRGGWWRIALAVKLSLDSCRGMGSSWKLLGGSFDSIAAVFPTTASVGVGNGWLRLRPRGILLTPNNGMQSIKVIRNKLGLRLNRMELNRCNRDFSDGFTIGGWGGTNPQGYTEGWIATIPEPRYASGAGYRYPFLSGWGESSKAFLFPAHSVFGSITSNRCSNSTSSLCFRVCSIMSLQTIVWAWCPGYQQAC